MQHRREVKGRESAHRLLSLWLGACTTSGIGDLCTATASERAHCLVELDDDNQCLHLQALRKQVSRCQRERGWQITELMLAAQTRTTCPSVKSLLRRVVVQLAGEVDSSVDRWKAPDAVRPPGLVGRTGKKRTLEPSVRASTIKIKNTDQRGKYWMSKALVGLLDSCARRASAEQIVSLAFDGGRLRKPPVEVNLCIAWLHGAELACVLPPTVSSEEPTTLPVPECIVQKTPMRATRGMSVTVDLRQITLFLVGFVASMRLWFLRRKCHPGKPVKARRNPSKPVKTSVFFLRATLWK
eukprot:6491047-Amphidinium_carterae.2